MSNSVRAETKELRDKVAEETIKQLLQEKEQMKAIVNYKQLIYHSQITQQFNEDEKDYVWIKISNAWLKHNGMQPNTKHNQGSRIIMKDKCNKILRVFKGINDCTNYIIGKSKEDKAFSTFYKNIRRCLNGEVDTAYGYIWEYDDEDED